MGSERLWLLQAVILLFLAKLLASATAQTWCHGNGNYTSNSTYKSNLDALLSSLSTSVDDNGFYNASMGQNPDTTYANVLCRGDVQLHICRSCIQNATIEIVNSCPNYKQAVLWDEFCTLRYSDESMFRVLMAADTPVFAWGGQNTSSPEQFMADLRTLVDDLRGQAATGGPLHKVAAGNRTTLNFQIFFMLVQCSPDLSSEDCSSCLIEGSGNIQKFCYGRRRCRVLQPNCNIRYEDVPFYNETRLQELQPLLRPLSPSSPPPRPPPGCINKGNYTRDSTYFTNLVHLLSSLASYVDSNGFYNASMGKSPDTAYASVLCRGDVQLHICHTCIQDAAVEIIKSCPNFKQAALWNEFCTLRYSNESMFGIMETTPASYYNTLSDPDKSVKDIISTLLGNLSGQSALGDSRRKIEAGNRTTPDFPTIYSLVQCTPDLSSENCSTCLIGATIAILNYCDVKIGCRALRPSCNIRYEVAQFYNETRLRELGATVISPLYPPPGKKDDNISPTIITVIFVPIAAFLILAACSGILLMKWIKKKSKEELQIVQEISASTESLQYDFGKIKAATGDFSDANKLGQGGFGDVYKGNLPNGQEIAVKRLSQDSRQGDVEFKNEVVLVARLQHRNLVRLLGFSIQGKEKLLVYEFVQNASLDRFLFDPVKRSDLVWDQRYKIIMGITKGLLYLHEESRLKIIHRDLKAGNILLDGDMNPKIADFGLARLFLSDETEGNTSKIVGTYGYMAPEYAMHGEFSVKSDVFSFGVLVLEIIRGQKNNSIRNGENIENLLSSAWKHWRKGTIEDMIDPVLRANSSTLDDMLRGIHIGLLCVQENPAHRPTMAAVVQMISNFNLSLPVPSQPAFFVPTSYDLDNAVRWGEYTSKDFESCESYSDNKPDQPILSSKNDLSITELYPR